MTPHIYTRSNKVPTLFQALGACRNMLRQRFSLDAPILMLMMHVRFNIDVLFIFSIQIKEFFSDHQEVD